MADAKFSFQEKGKMYHPAWIAPEVRIKFFVCKTLKYKLMIISGIEKELK